MSLFIVEAILFAIFETGLFVIKCFAESIVNRVYAIQQMAIATGFQYQMTLNAIDNVWRFLSVSCAILYLIIIYFKARKDK